MRMYKVRIGLEGSQLQGCCNHGDRGGWLKEGWWLWRWREVDGVESNMSGRIKKTRWLIKCGVRKKGVKGDSWTWATGWMVVPCPKTGVTEEQFCEKSRFLLDTLSLPCQWDSSDKISCWPLAVPIWNLEERSGPEKWIWETSNNSWCLKSLGRCEITQGEQDLCTVLE